MRVLKIVSAAFSVLMSAVLIGCGSEDKNSNGNEVEEMQGLFNVKKVGRTYENDKELWLALSGSGAEFVFTGDTLKISMMGNRTDGKEEPRAAVFVDGERKADVMLPDKQTDIEIKGKGSEPVTVQIIKLSEAAQSCCAVTAIDPGNGSIKPAPVRQHKIEFIGDSITCGYGVDDENENHHFSTSTEDCTRAYAYKTARLLDADYSLFSYSGWGIISGYTESGSKLPNQQVPKVYEKLAFTNSKGFGSVTPQSIAWDFSAFQPDAVVINLGTNDASYCGDDAKRREDYTSSYVNFLKKVREKNPSARIFCTLGIMDGRLNTCVQDAAKRYTEETGDSNVRTFMFKMQDMQNDGLVADWHPTEKTHAKSAEALAEFIRSDMGW